ncbi:MAG: hypothetical protein ACPGVZ_16905 [Myxococcota bacterium]
MIGRARSLSARWLDRARHGRTDWSGIASPVCGGVLAIAPAGYTGVANATRRLFPATVEVDAAALVLEGDRRELVQAMLASGADRMVFSGWIDGFAEVARGLKRARPASFVGALWHGTPMQLADADERLQYDRVVTLLREGVLDRVGFLKTGEGEAHARRGLTAVDVFNPPPEGTPKRATIAREADAPLRVGLFSAGPSWRKNPYAMLAALARLDQVALTGVLDAAAQAHARALGLALAHVRSDPFDEETLATRLGAQDCNLYVTLSECSPLLPLESLHLGVPCLIGASSHLFAGTPLLDGGGATEAAQFLDARLVVARADDPRAIAEAIRGAVDDRAAIADAYSVWAPAYAAHARDAIAGFLSDAPGPGA